MKKIANVLILIALTVVLMAPTAVLAKKPHGAYISSAKIELSSNDTARYRAAENMLDSVFIYYGPHSEALFLKGRIQGAWMEKVSRLEDKVRYATLMAAYADSLRLCCSNDKIKKKFRDKCDEYTETLDSNVAQLWRTYYNEGVGQLGEIERVAKEKKAAADSADRAFYQQRLDRLVDSAVTNLDVATVLDPSDHRAYVGVAQVYEREEAYAKANEWYARAAEHTDEVATLYLSMSYNSYYAKDFCEAAANMARYVEVAPNDTANLGNLGVFYNLCGDYPAAAETYKRMLELDPTNKDALLATGQYFNELARYDNDSSTAAREAGNEDAAAEWMEKRNQKLDSSMHYFGTALEANPDDCAAARQYGSIAFVVGKYEDAAEAYDVITQSCNASTDDWITLGDAYIYLQRWADAIPPYEKVIETDAENKEILERLVDLNKQVDNDAKAQEYQTKLDALPSGGDGQ